MKISKWEELDGNRNSIFETVINHGAIEIKKPFKTLVQIDYDSLDKVTILTILKLFGFDIEFEEAPKLSKREWHLVNFLEECWWIARDESKYLYAHEIRPSKSNGEWGSLARHDFIELPDVLFPFITPDREWSVKELRELEVEE